MKDKDILDMLGLNDRTITLTADDEYLQIMLEKKIDNYLKKLYEEKKKEEQIDYYKNQYEKFQKKNEFVKNFDDRFIYRKLRDKLIWDGFIYRCKFCWGLDVSGQYVKYPKQMTIIEKINKVCYYIYNIGILI